MATKPSPQLNSRAVAVLEMIAAGNTYEQILAAYPDLRYLDIFEVARDVLDLLASSHPKRKSSYTLAEKRQRYSRAYEKWTDKEDGQLRQLLRSGTTVARIAGILQRNRGAIRSRILKRELTAELSEKERLRFQRIIARQNRTEER
ncbi:MAG TPA: hypothetical protein VG722_05575 [Tepidisphaeraceae bacterium]|nr:hypothetical protein [Tepidisphaeraceae bacterium]